MTRTASGGQSIIEPETFVWTWASSSHGYVRCSRHNARRSSSLPASRPSGDTGSLVFLPGRPSAPKGVKGRAIVVLKSHFWLLHLARGEGFEQPHAAIPAEHGVIVLRRTHRLRLLEIAHGLLEEPCQHFRRAAGPHLSFGAPLTEKTGVIEALVG